MKHLLITILLLCTVSSFGQTFTVNGVSFNMIKVEGGTFMMGANDDDEYAFETEKPSHKVTISNYSIGETEVTQALWKAVMGNNPSYNKGDNLPVEQVSWDDCQKFISKLNILTGKTFCLPTEAQWEYAARGGRKNKGYKYCGSNDIDDVAWYLDNSGDMTHAVATKHANELGLYDMLGNVNEWCLDYWKQDYGPLWQLDKTGRVFRGLCYYDLACDCRVSFRDGYTPDGDSASLGFRLALNK